jgi:hypothetical protein
MEIRRVPRTRTIGVGPPTEGRQQQMTVARRDHYDRVRGIDMNKLIFDDSGLLVAPALHDARIYRIDFGGKQVAIYLNGADGQGIRLELHRVAHMFTSGLAEQNIVLDVSAEYDLNTSAETLSRMLPGHGESQRKYRDLLLQQLRSRGLTLLRISPSYGGEILVLYEDALYEAHT